MRSVPPPVPSPARKAPPPVPPAKAPVLSPISAPLPLPPADARTEIEIMSPDFIEDGSAFDVEPSFPIVAPSRQPADELLISGLSRSANIVQGHLAELLRVAQLVRHRARPAFARLKDGAERAVEVARAAANLRRPFYMDEESYMSRLESMQGASPSTVPLVAVGLGLAVITFVAIAI